MNVFRPAEQLVGWVKPITNSPTSNLTAYKRNYLTGGTYFFTVNLAERRLSLLTDHIDELRSAFKIVKSTHPFSIDAIVILPDHLHTVWTLPDGDSDYSNRWRKIKGCFSRSMPNDERISTSRASKGERGIWQRRYWEHTIRDELDYHRHVDYIHFSPVKHSHYDHVSKWSYPSFHSYVEKRFYPEDWGFDPAHLNDDFGESSES